MEALPLQLDRVRDGLVTERLGTKFHYFPTVDSTNRTARILAEQGAEEGEIVIAERQTQGRGRLGRTWVSPAFVNLYFSIVLRPTLRPEHAPQITLAAAVALADAVDAFSPIVAAIKWPNDILLNRRKLAGILMEAACDRDRIEYVILGIGVNVNFVPDSMPPELRERATSLRAVRDENVNREAFLRRLIRDLDRCYGVLQGHGFGAIAARWQERFYLRNQPVRVAGLDEVTTGIAIGIDLDGALILRGPDGKLERIVAGDVTAAVD